MEFPFTNFQYEFLNEEQQNKSVIYAMPMYIPFTNEKYFVGRVYTFLHSHASRDYHVGFADECENKAYILVSSKFFL